MREYELLVGILAYQLRLVSRGTLAHYVAALASSPGLPLLDYLVDVKALSETDQRLLCRLADTVVHAHHGDEKAALRAFGGDEAASEAFSSSLERTDHGWQPGEEQTIQSERLPHGLPAQIAPETIGRYTRGSEYARGGIGRILLVHDEQIGRDIILKELLPESTSSPTDSTLSRSPHPESPKSPIRQSAAMMARFLQEAKITGQLEHPSIVPVYELGTRRDGKLYYTMKLVRGDTLAVAIKNAKSPKDRLALLRNFLDVCQAMAYAHAKGVVHRDLKPSNIMVGEFGECVVLDWGLAKLQKDQDAHREAMEKTISQFKLGEEQLANLKTRSKEVLGTPLYMAPEQARGDVDSVGLHSDVYSLGVILYEILSGDLPHPWTNSLDTIRRVGSLPAPTIKKVAPKTPPELAAICDKALAFATEDRYASARDLARDVQRFLEGAVVDAYAYGVIDILTRLYRKHKPMILTTCAATLLLVLMGVVSYINIFNARIAEENARILAEQEREKAESQRAAAESARSEAERSLDLARRQQYLGQIRLAQAHIQDQQMRLANEALQKAPESERDWVWRYLHNEANPELFSVRSEKSLIKTAQYDPSGNFIMAVRNPEPPGMWNAQTGEFVRNLEGDYYRYNATAFDPDGTRFAAIGENGVLDIWDVATGRRLQHLTYAGEGLSVSFTSDKNTLWAGYDDGALIAWNVDSGERIRTMDTQGQSVILMYPLVAGSTLLTLYRNALEQERDAIVAWDTENAQIRYTLPGIGIWPAPSGNTFVRVAFPALLDDGAPPPQSPYSKREWSKLAVHDGESGAQIAEYRGHRDRVFHVSYDASEERIVSASMDRFVRVWQGAEFTPRSEFFSDIPVMRAYFARESDEVIGCTSDNRYLVWDVSTKACLAETVGQNDVLSTAELSHDGSRLLTASSYHTFQVFNATRPRQLDVVAFDAPVPPETRIGVTDIALARSESTAAVVWDRRIIRTLDLTSLEWLARFDCEPGTQPRIALSPDGSQLLYCQNPTTLMRGTVSNGDTATFATTSKPITAVAISDDGARVATATEMGELTIWNAATGERRNGFSLTAVVRSIAFGPRTGNLVVGYDDGSIRVYEGDGDEILLTITASAGSIVDVAVSGNEEYIASASADGSIALWNAVSGEVRATFGVDESYAGTTDERVSLRCGPDGRYLTVHYGLYRTLIIDLVDCEALLQSLNGLRLDVLRDGASLLRITQPGVLALTNNTR